MSTDSAITVAQGMMSRGDYGGAHGVLRSLGLRGASYYRVDEILYHLGRCNVALRNFREALEGFTLLRHYYASCDERFTDLMHLEAEARDSLPDKANPNDRATPSTNLASGTASRADSEPLVSNVYFETDVRQVLTDLSAQTHISIVPDALVQGTVTLEIKGVPLEAALDQVLTPLGCSFRRMGSYYLVGKDSPDSPAYAILTETKLVTLNNVDADAAAALVPQYYKDRIQVDKNSKTMSISASPSTIERFSEVLSSVDMKRQQFVIEVAVVDITSSAQRMLGINWDWTGTKGNQSFEVARLGTKVTDSSFRATYSALGSKHWDFTQNLRLTLEALEASGKARFRANPQLTTQNGREAAISVGREAYYSLVSGSVAYPYFTLEKIATGVSLKITPYMGQTPEVTNDVDIEVSDVTGSGANDLPVTSVRKVKTRVQVGNGQTFGIGGLVTRHDRKDVNRIPILGSIPFIGYLFGQTDHAWDETEVVIIVTPHALVDGEVFREL